MTIFDPAVIESMIAEREEKERLSIIAQQQEAWECLRDERTLNALWDILVAREFQGFSYYYPESHLQTVPTVSHESFAKKYWLLGRMGVLVSTTDFCGIDENGTYVSIVCTKEACKVEPITENFPKLVSVYRVVSSFIEENTPVQNIDKDDNDGIGPQPSPTKPKWWHNLRLR